MFAQLAPTMLLEIKVISAHDLPPVSRILRNYAVARLDHDNVSKTAVDRHGGTSPTWNHKFAFSVDDKFLGSKTSEIKFEIYNVAWLRDLPMGTASLMINTLSPRLSPRNPAMRSVALRIRRPTGHLRGVLNIAILLKDNNPPPAADKISKSLERKNDNVDERVYQKEWKCETKKTMQKNDEKSCLKGQERISHDSLSHVEFVSRPAGKVARFVYEDDRNCTDLKSRITNNTTNGSGTHRLSLSEVAGVEEDDLGESIFDTWIVAAAGDDRDEEIIPGKDNGSRRGGRRSLHRRSQSDGVGLFSCMNFCGYNCMNKKKKLASRRKKMIDDDDDHTVPFLSWSPS